MSRRDRRCVLVVTTAGSRGRWTRARGSRRGVCLVRDLSSPPPPWVDELGDAQPGGWSEGACTPGEPPGIVQALAAETRPGVRIDVYLATVTASTVAEWRAALGDVVGQVRDASAGWGMPRTVVLTRARSAQLEADILARWPGIRVVWAGPQGDARPAITLDDVETK